MELARVLLTLSATLVIIGCTERQIHAAGASGPIAWQVTDFRIVARSVQGTPRDLYTFTLVLQETQGTALTFRQVVSRLTHPSIPTLPTGNPGSFARMENCASPFPSPYVPPTPVSMRQPWLPGPSTSPSLAPTSGNNSSAW